MIHPATALQWISNEVGFGVVATELLPMGTITVAPDPLDLRLTRAELERLPEQVRAQAWHFMYLSADERFVLAWDHARYINHSCDANTMLSEAGLEVAVRDIQRGEELTTEYALLRPQEALVHRCPKGACRGVVEVGERERVYPLCEPKLKVALERAPRLSQPLAPLIHWT